MSAAREQQDSPVGWCHSCGTVQLKSEMPESTHEYTDGAVPCCVKCLDEPWGMGVWDKGVHRDGCAWFAAARERVVEWTPDFPCDCPAQAGT